MALSLIALFIKNMSPYYEFLTTKLWITTIFGTIIILCSSFPLVGVVTINKCHIKILLLSIGLTMILIPLLCQLTINFPQENNFSNWVKRHKNVFILFFIILDLILNGFNLIKPLYNMNLILTDEINFNICKLNGIFGISIVTLIIFIKIVIILFILLLLFVEWNIKKTFYDIRFVTYAIYSTALVIIVFFTIDYITFKNYKTYFLIQELLFSLLSISNYFLLYGNKLLLAFMKKKNINSVFIKKINNHFINNDVSTVSKNITNTNNFVSTTTNAATEISNGVDRTVKTGTKSSSTVSTLLAKIIGYHYMTEIDNDLMRYYYSETNTNYTNSNQINEVSNILL